MRRLLFTLLTLSATVMSAQVATIVESDTEFEFTGANSAVCRMHQVIRVNNEHGVDAALFACYCSKGNTLTRFSGTITDANGKVIGKPKKSDLVRSEYSKEFSTDQYMYLYGYQSHSYPYTVTYDWEESIEGGIRAIPPFAPQPGFEIDVLSATYRIISKEKNNYRYKSLNFTPEIKESTDAKGRKVMELAVKNLPAVPHYSYSLPLDKQVPMMYVSPTSFVMDGTSCDLTDWGTFGLWVKGLLKDRDRIPDALASKLKELTDTCSSVRGKVEAVRRFMGETTRYISIQHGLGGYQTMSVEEVYRKGIGDCKALSNYFCSMLHSLGIPARYVHISTNHKRLLDFPNMQQLNHVIAQVPLPGDTLWVECTNATYPYDYLPANLRDHDVVIETDQSFELARTPALVDSDNREMNQYDIILSADGNAKVHLNRQLMGNMFDAYLGMTKLSSSDQRKTILSDINLPSTTLNEVQMKHEKHVFSLDVDFTAEKYGKRTGDRLFVPMAPNALSGLRNANEPAHVLDLEDSGFDENTVIAIHLPEGCEVEHLPESSTAASAFGSFSISSERKDGSIVIRTELKIRSGIYPKEQYEEWVAWRKQITSLASAKLVLRLK